jgi:hypothetical protein
MGFTAPSDRGAMAPKENSITRYSQTRRNDLFALAPNYRNPRFFSFAEQWFSFRVRKETPGYFLIHALRPHATTSPQPWSILRDLDNTSAGIHGSVTSHRSIYGRVCQHSWEGKKNSTAVPMNLACYVSSDSRLSLMVTSILPG